MDTIDYLHKQERMFRMVESRIPSSLLWFHSHHHTRNSLTDLYEWFRRNFYHFPALGPQSMRNHQYFSSCSLVKNIGKRKEKPWQEHIIWFILFYFLDKCLPGHSTEQDSSFSVTPSHGFPGYNKSITALLVDFWIPPSPQTLPLSRTHPSLCTHCHQ